MTENYSHIENYWLYDLGDLDTNQKYMSLPKWYKDWIERVSNIVSFMFPFKGTDWEQRYLDWLRDKGIDQKEYMNEACSVWTFIHLQMEHEVNWEEQDKKDKLYDKHNKEIVAWLEYIRRLKKKYWEEVDWHTEVVVKDEYDRYQGSYDLIRINEETKTVWLYDWKTWGVAKKRWWLPNSAKKNSDKLKKVALQLSLYAETYRQKGYTVWGIYVVHLHDEEGAIEWSLRASRHKQKVKSIKIWTTEEINELFVKYDASKIVKEKLPEATLIFNETNMIVTIQEPTKQYGYVNVSLDLSKTDDGQTWQESINSMIKAIKYTKENINK